MYWDREREREKRKRERDLDTKLLEVLLYHVPLCQGAMDNVLKLSSGPLIKSASVEVSSCFEIDINIWLIFGVTENSENYVGKKFKKIKKKIQITFG